MECVGIQDMEALKRLKRDNTCTSLLAIHLSFVSGVLGVTGGLAREGVGEGW